MKNWFILYLPEGAYFLVKKIETQEFYEKTVSFDSKNTLCERQLSN